MSVDQRDVERADDRKAREPAVEQSLEEEVVSGRSPATPFVVLGSAAAVVWTAVALVSLAILLVWWLA